MFPYVLCVLCARVCISWLSVGTFDVSIGFNCFSSESSSARSASRQRSTYSKVS
jgi:hypothetical protein